MNEGKTFLKVNQAGGQEQDMQQPMPQPPMPETPTQQQPPMDQPPMGGQDMGQEMPDDNGGQSEFDTNFDAGVEADEDTDPKKYIQQLTGKLSTTLNNYNTENDDEGLNKYVAKMIVKQATKNMDDADKKEIIKAINTSDTNKDDDEEEEVEIDTDETETIEEPQEEQQPVQESVITRGRLRMLKERLKRELKK